MSESKPSLTPRQKRFIDEYLEDLNPKRAYECAGYKSRGRSAQNNASRLLSNPIIQAELAHRQASTARQLEITQEMVLRGLLKQARLGEESGRPSMPAVRAWELIGRHIGMRFGDRFDVEIRLNEQLAAAVMKFFLRMPPETQEEFRAFLREMGHLEAAAVGLPEPDTDPQAKGPSRTH